VSDHGSESFESGLVHLAEAALSSGSLTELAEGFLAAVVESTKTSAAFLHVEDVRLREGPFFHVGLSDGADAKISEACANALEIGSVHGGPGDIGFPLELEGYSYALYLLDGHVRGVWGLTATSDSPVAAAFARQASVLIGHGIRNLAEHSDCQRQIANLNAYLNVSAMIAQALDLRDVLEASLFFCMDHLSAEAASVLLLDYSKENFRFYSTEGPTKPVLAAATFPAGQGLAGSVMEARQAEVFNDVQADPRFYNKFDSDSDFVTRNMIAVPLIAGDEDIGVLEVINKVDGDFSDDDLMFLQTVAEEIAFAVRNAKLFEVVVKSYCKQRQGLNTCRGCKRPLGSWTPCVKYREDAGLLEA
jgi:hypothetical protein